MNEMNEQELMELEHWIQVNLFGYLSVYKSWTSDPAANRELEMKLIEKCGGIHLSKCGSGGFVATVSVYSQDFEPYADIEGTAQTLSLAICLLAKKVYQQDL